MFFRGSLRWRVAFSYISVFVLVMVGLNVFLSWYVRDTFLTTTRTHIIQDTRMLASEAERLWQGAPTTQPWIELANRYARLLNSQVTLLTPDGAVAAESSRPAEPLDNHLNRPEVDQALQGQEFIQTRYSTTLGQELLYSAVPIHDNNQIIGVARLATSLADINASVNMISSTILAATALSIAVTILLAVLLTNYTTLPLRKLTERAVQLSSIHDRAIQEKTGSAGSVSNLSNSSLRKQGDEVARLEFAFDQLANRLNIQIDEYSAERGKLDAVLASMADGVIIVDPEGNVQLVNPAAARIFNLAEPDAAIGQTLIETVRHHQLVELWQNTQKSGYQQMVTLETSPDRLFIQCIATPLVQAVSGTILIIFQDLTRMRRLEIVRRDFVSNVSHELRTPLASLKALTETLQEGALEDPPAARRFLLRMENEIDNLTQMVQELLELSRIESGKVPLKRTPIDPLELASMAVERMLVQAERAAVHLKLEIPENLPQVSADATRMGQVIVNLIHNAIKFTPPGGEIVVSAFLQQEMVVFRVHDSGVGISPELLPRIFERFYKVDRSRSSGGTGLGLSIARHMVEAHGGRIWAESEVGQGSTFFFSLPQA